MSATTAIATTSTLRARPLTGGWPDLEAVRRIRNAGRRWFTRDTRAIGVEEQRRWWAGFRGRAWVYQDSRGAVVGYGTLTMRDGERWVSLGVTPGWRGCGYGTAIYADLATRARGPVAAEIRRDNIASRRAAEKAGYVCDAERGDLIVMVRR